MAKRLTDEEKFYRAIKEASFQRDVQKLMTACGWRWYHPADNMPRGGWKANITPGFPDLTAVRGKRILFAELKSEMGKTTEDQDGWLRAFRLTGAEVYIWRPSHWNKIREILA